MPEATISTTTTSSSRWQPIRCLQPFRMLAFLAFLSVAISLSSSRSNLSPFLANLQVPAYPARILGSVETTETPINTSIPSSHNPRRFSDNVQLNIDRGLNIINCWSGQTMATWIYNGEVPLDMKFKSWFNEPESKLLRSLNDVDKIHANDTIFVSFVKLQEFTHDFLPWIEQEFVLITESWHLLYPTWVHEVAGNIVRHPKLLHWFSNNIGNYTGGLDRHPKVSPFPLGLKPNMPGARPGSYRAPISTYREVFLQSINMTTTINKTTTVFVGYLRPTNERRRNIPSSGKDLDYREYLLSLASSFYVLSPDGDHPDCHRHYEALGMGAIPVTELDPFLYRHLADGPVIFKNNNWNLTDLETNLSAATTVHVNRNLVFEEYWMEYVERGGGRPLRWWDVVQQAPCFLDDFATSKDFMASHSMIDEENREPNVVTTRSITIRRAGRSSI